MTTLIYYTQAVLSVSSPDEHHPSTVSSDFRAWRGLCCKLSWPLVVMRIITSPSLKIKLEATLQKHFPKLSQLVMGIEALIKWLSSAGTRASASGSRKAPYLIALLAFIIHPKLALLWSVIGMCASISLKWVTVIRLNFERFPLFTLTVV